MHGFSTRDLGDMKAGGAEPGWPGEWGAVELVLLRQVHGTAVVDAARGSPNARPEGDAWVGSPVPGRALGILTADCLPLLLVHARSRRLAVIHAGWRGAVRGVAEAALQRLAVPAAEVFAALGPAIGPCCYQVGGEVAASVGRGSAYLTPWPESPGHFHFDLPGYLQGRLVAAGIPGDQIESLPLCTHCRADLFFSHRRAADPQRMVAFAGWAGDPAGCKAP
jgi:YfiH family protein